MDYHEYLRLDTAYSSRAPDSNPTAGRFARAASLIADHANRIH